MPNNNISNENEDVQTSDETMVEKYDDKKHFLMIPYQRGKGEQVIKSVRKTIERLWPSNIKVQVCFTGNKHSSCYNIKDKTKFEHRHDVIYLETCPERTSNDNYIGGAKWQIFDSVKDHSGRDFISHVLKHALENNHQHVSEKDFKIIGNGFRGNNKKRKVAEALLIREIKPTLNIQDQSVPLQLFS